jgi:Ser/Thr protein kinase RdoA (MazF antagonist)
VTQAPPSFPVVHSVLDPAALCAEVAAQYSLGVPSTCILLRSWINEVYELRIHTQRFILKVFRRGWRSPAEVEYEVALMRHLEAHGLRVAPPLARRDGTIVGLIPAPEGSRPAVLYPLLEGRPPLPPDESIYYQVGQTIARMHQALDTFAPAHPRPALDLRYLAERPLRWMQPHLQARPTDWEFLERLVQRIQTRLATLQQAGGLAWGPIHGDATLDNLLITDDHQIGIYDFDQSGSGWRAYEMQGVYYYTWSDQRPSFWAAIVDGYRSVQPLSATDIAAMPCFVVLNRLWCMGFEAHVIAGNHGQWIVDAAYFDKRLAILRRWAAAHSELSVES